MVERPIQDWEYPEPDPLDEDEEVVETIPCPICRKQVYEDATYCPHCGTEIDEVVPTVFRGRPVWFILLAMAGIIAFILVFALPHTAP